jgi:hypothetical protein
MNSTLPVPRAVLKVHNTPITDETLEHATKYYALVQSVCATTFDHAFTQERVGFAVNLGMLQYTVVVLHAGDCSVLMRHLVGVALLAMIETLDYPSINDAFVELLTNIWECNEVKVQRQLRENPTLVQLTQRVLQNSTRRLSSPTFLPFFVKFYPRAVMFLQPDEVMQFYTAQVSAFEQVKNELLATPEIPARLIDALIQVCVTNTRCCCC